MLYTYTYIKHDVEKLQSFLDFLFFEVWCKAEGAFDASKLEGNPELQQLYMDLGNSESDWADFFNSNIQLIYEAFLDEITEEADKAYITDAYISNNNIEGICTDKTIVAITYDAIAQQYPKVAAALKIFYGKLYGSSSPFNLEAFGQMNKKLLPSHYEDFMKINKEEVCPFCGINHLKANNSSCREAYDHYIPKGQYPFSTLNFANLAPMCHECNSSYKLTKLPIYKNDAKKIDPIQQEQGRCLAFYPYATIHPKLVFSIALNTRNIDEMNHSDIDVTITADGFDEQIVSWKRVFGSDERYKALLCSPNEGKAWFNSIFEEFENAKVLSDIQDADQYYKAQLKDANKFPLSSYGFLKARFLETCHADGLFVVKDLTP